MKVNTVHAIHPGLNLSHLNRSIYSLPEKGQENMERLKSEHRADERTETVN